jgi:cellulose synthase/poly-beta-1,6-N-acetylglucosamine synthase-like glycosyltransferase
MVCRSLVRPVCGHVCCVGRFPARDDRLNALTTILSRRRYRSPGSRSPRSSLPPEFLPGVSILRPLKGLETNLFENLESTFLQEYPNFEIIFSVANEYDQALPVVRTLLEKYPHSSARVIVGTSKPLISVGALP